ncbi:MAG: hypothetical protein NXH86_17055 [Flavobacteriaceae bacterium]|uniref:Uncharacterized protein n=1 Tax=Phaeodactylibacter xiamenensis TaxID=1524460 RepID=A0A098S5W2_9BACT|nr:hypothetical protein [Phaeodactylibacter xiamenensis]KGE86617.1 hypothetical protein IX84_20210 [Phaeodactylibacter xiamenensis]MCR9265865.1 hypothetical protein [Flavobacteriaceae bacterium]
MKKIESGIYLKTEGGLCNRMRSIDSAYILKELFKKKLFVIWENNHEVGANFEEIFEPLPEIKMLSTEPLFLKKLNKLPRILKNIYSAFYSISPDIRNDAVKEFCNYLGQFAK